jgi:hypothetical protein
MIIALDLPNMGIVTKDFPLLQSIDNPDRAVHDKNMQRIVRIDRSSEDVSFWLRLFVQLKYHADLDTRTEVGNVALALSLPGGDESKHSSQLVYHLTVLFGFGATTPHWDDHRGDGPGEVICNLNVNGEVLYAFEHDMNTKRNDFNYATVVHPGEILTFFGMLRHCYVHAVYRLDARKLGPENQDDFDEAWQNLKKAAEDKKFADNPLRIVVTSRWGKPSGEWYRVCEEVGHGASQEEGHEDAWEPPRPAPKREPTKKAAADPPRSSARKAKREAEVKIRKQSTSSPDGLSLDTDKDHSAEARVEASKKKIKKLREAEEEARAAKAEAEGAARSRWKDGRAAKSVLNPAPTNLAPKAHVTCASKDVKLVPKTVVCMMRGDNVKPPAVNIFVAEVGVIVTGKDTKTRYVIVCAGAYGPGQPMEYEEAFLVDANAFLKWPKGLPMRPATQEEVESATRQVNALATKIHDTTSKLALRPRNTKNVASGIFDKANKQSWKPLTAEQERSWSQQTPQLLSAGLVVAGSPEQPGQPATAADIQSLVMALNQSGGGQNDKMVLPGTREIEAYKPAAPQSSSSSSSSSLGSAFMQPPLANDPEMATDQKHSLKALDALTASYKNPVFQFAAAAIKAQSTIQVNQARAEALLQEQEKTMQARLQAAAAWGKLEGLQEAKKDTEAIQKRYTGNLEEQRRNERNDRKEMWGVHKQLLLKNVNKKRQLHSASDPESDSSSASDDSSSTCSDSSSDDEIRKMKAKIKKIKAKRKAAKKAKKSKNKKKKRKRE